MIRTVILVLALVALASNAEARQRHHRTYIADPGCNVIFPCQGVTTSPRGEAISKSIGFGSPQKVYTPRSMHRRNNSYSALSPGLVRSVSGATAHVAASARYAFQCLVDRLDAAGYPVRFMGGWRAHGSVRGSLHPSGLALDVNQLRRNVTRPAMPSNEIQMANNCGLISGRQWANGDSGHFQLGGWAGGGGRHYAGGHHRHYASAR